MTRFLFTVFLLCGLLACHSDKLDSKVIKGNKWKLVDGELRYKNLPVDWQQADVIDCDNCKIERKKLLHPSGPLESFKLTEKGRLRAMKSRSYSSLVEFEIDEQAVRLPVSSSLQEGNLMLTLNEKKVEFSKGSIFKFSYADHTVQLFVKQLTFNQQSMNYANEQADIEFEYLLLIL